MQAVFVAGTRDPDWKSYKAFMAGITLYEEQGALAPGAPLRFVLRPRTPGSTVAGVRMSIEAGDALRIAVPIAADGSFALPHDPEAARQGAEIVLTKRRNALSWRPAIHTPGVAPGTRRLGDLRLECLVRWTIEQADLLQLFRATINAFGGPCNSAAIKVDYISERPIAAVTLVAGDRREQLAARWIEEQGHVYLPPVHDRSWPDDTVLVFDYAGAAADRK